MLGLQALVWIVVALAFAALTEVAGWTPRREAMIYSATHWLPWIVLAPLVIWLSRRFPFERGRLLHSVPAHLVACAFCCVVLFWVSAYFAPSPRGRMQFRELSALKERRESAARSTGEPGAAGGARPAGDTVWKTAVRTGSEPRKGPPPPMRTSGRMPGADRIFGRFLSPFSSLALRANVSAAVYLIIACLAHAFAYYRRAQERQNEAMALAAGLNRAKLDALRSQLQPHFLFNTLNAISTLVHRDANAADEMIGDLSELLRLSLQTAEHEVPLSRELELLDRYLAIEQTRLGERLRVVREIDPQALAALVPTFVLQPLVENAIRHGIEPRLAAGTLRLRAQVEDEILRLIVSDDGVGLQANGVRAARRGIGLANTEQRLRVLHGEAARLELFSPEGGGVQVQLTLPRRTTPASIEPAGGEAAGSISA